MTRKEQIVSAIKLRISELDSLIKPRLQFEEEQYNSYSKLELEKSYLEDQLIILDKIMDEKNFQEWLQFWPESLNLSR